MSEQTGFGGAKKVGESVLGAWEKRFVARNLPRVPGWLETYHLTLMTIAWSMLVLVFSHLAKGNLHWMWAVSAMVAMQYFTDLFDGAVGRSRNTGLVKWGFFMDHLLDFIFLSAVVVGYYMISPPGLELYFFGILTLTGAFMVVSFLSFGATNEFEIYHFGMGPTEIRIVFILINAAIVFLGTDIWSVTVPAIFYLLLAALVVMTWMTHRRLWKIDMENLKKGD